MRTSFWENHHRTSKKNSKNKTKQRTKNQHNNHNTSNDSSTTKREESQAKLGQAILSNHVLKQNARISNAFHCDAKPRRSSRTPQAATRDQPNRKMSTMQPEEFRQKNDGSIFPYINGVTWGY